MNAQENKIVLVTAESRGLCRYMAINLAKKHEQLRKLKVAER